MKTFIISATIATLAATVSFAGVGDMVENGYGKTLEVIVQDTGSSGNTRVVLLNDRDQERTFTVKANGKVKGKGGKRLKSNISAMVIADRVEAEIAEEEAQAAREDRAQEYNLAYCPDNTNDAGSFYHQPLDATWSVVYEMCGGLIKD